MAQVINTNVMSLNAQRNLNTNSASLATTIQRLSSGLRINSARDDAAGLAISQRMTAQIRGMEQAIRNANDGISLAQTAEGALVEIGNNLQRIRELAVQSANATNSDTDRQALNAEVTQLLSEIDRVAKQSDFNGTKLLNGSFTGALFQVGANAGQAIAIDKVVDARVASLGESTFASGTLSKLAATREIEVGGEKVTVANTLSINDIDIDLSNVKTVTTGEADSEVTSFDAESLASAINAKIGETGVFAEVGEGGGLVLSSVKAGEEITVAAGTDVAADPNVPNSGSIAFAATKNVRPVFADGIDISTVKGAQQALSIVDKALEAVNGSRADLGAIQNRFTSVVANLNTSSENLSASRSRIQDTDYAKETAELTRTQILQQAGTAMLAQAKAIPQSVLSLLQ